MTGQNVGAQNTGHLFAMQRVQNGRGHAGADRHGQKGSIESMPVRQAEADIRGATGGIDAELLAQTTDEPERRGPGLAQGANGHDQRIDHDIRFADAIIRGVFNDLSGNLETDIGIFGDTAFIVRYGDDGGTMFLDQRQDRFQPLFLAGHRIYHRDSLLR